MHRTAIGEGNVEAEDALSDGLFEESLNDAWRGRLPSSESAPRNHRHLKSDAVAEQKVD
jgi:hypothetical protein